MRVAICLSGHLRSYKKNLQSLHTYLINKDHQFDFFIHTWNQVDRVNIPIVEKEVMDLYHPKKIAIEPQKQFIITPMMRKKNINNRDINGVLSMFYKIKECNQLKRQYEQQNGFIYDWVIRLRPDINLQSPIVLTESNQKLYIPKYGDYGGLNDQFAYSSSKNMDSYCSTFDYIEKYLNKGLSLNPEFFTLETVKRMAVSIERPEINYDIIWYNGRVWNNLTRHPGVI